ncbi:hypothetical protein [Rhizobium sp. FY34]|uniref:hypothetical protein n=1 Tax=Rhizobium sp. FY34 TaxID=2562309 RepID=UPI001484F856|nr:hypothetical protein [Rhizobium sp. FY34]
MSVPILAGRPAPSSDIAFAAGPGDLQFCLTESNLCLAIFAQRFRVWVLDSHKGEPHAD